MADIGTAVFITTLSGEYFCPDSVMCVDFYGGECQADLFNCCKVE